ncbi:MAG TPA: methylated-DNA--[protein]-cysteine S-methyltransferase [Pseudomonadaceae bacterium]|nr:methylated-DNA--[protein]-cysteine S-methyltransferase [Pseudomonadaceae bacterium]
MSDYERIAKAIHFLQEQLPQQPGLDELATHLHLSPFHLQRLFSRWAGISPKRFLQVLTLELGKQLLDADWPVLQASAALGLSSASRLHDHFVTLDAVSPGEYRRKGAGLTLRYGWTDTPFGRLFVAASPRGICQAVFMEAGEEQASLAALRSTWPGAKLEEDAHYCEALGRQILASLSGQPAEKPVQLHVQGTNFQLSVWRALLSIPSGKAVSYGQLAAACGKPGAARATGSAVGANPVALLIPCHRVIQQSGALGGYRWGIDRKLALQAWERLEAGNS